MESFYEPPSDIIYQSEEVNRLYYWFFPLHDLFYFPFSHGDFWIISHVLDEHQIMPEVWDENVNMLEKIQKNNINMAQISFDIFNKNAFIFYFKYLLILSSRLSEFIHFSYFFFLTNRKYTFLV